MLSKILVIIGD